MVPSPEGPVPDMEKAAHAVLNHSSSNDSTAGEERALR